MLPRTASEYKYVSTDSFPINLCMLPCSSDYIIILTDVECFEATWLLLPYGIVVAPSDFSARLRIDPMGVSLNSLDLHSVIANRGRYSYVSVTSAHARAAYKFCGTEGSAMRHISSQYLIKGWDRCRGRVQLAMVEPLHLCTHSRYCTLGGCATIGRYQPPNLWWTVEESNLYFSRARGKFSR
jgi:hypothetical protein